MNSDASTLFGYNNDEIINKKRVSLFSPGEIVLQNVEKWLAEAVKNGSYETSTTFIKKNGTSFNAKVKITPTYKNGQHIGYCGITEEINEDIKVKISVFTKILKWLVIMRAPFLSAALVPCGIGLLFALINRSYVDNITVFLAFMGVCTLHLFSNVLNDYFDWKSGVDQANTKYFTKFSGGSRSIELGLINHKNTLLFGIALGLIALLIGFTVYLRTNVITLYIGLTGLLLGYFYTAPPLYLVSRKGLGELTIFFTFGPLITLGMYYICTLQLSWDAFLIGIPAGLLTTNILLINEVPDYESDKLTGKNHLLATYGLEKAPVFYFIINLLAFLSTVSLIYHLNLITLWAPAIITLIWGTKLSINLKNKLHDRELVSTNIQTIALSAISGIIFIGCLFIEYYYLN
jgi:1,4-dihydroxy-2-naphthoate polyprenyltransferase